MYNCFIVNKSFHNERLLIKKKKSIAIHTHTLKIMYTVFGVSMYVDRNLQFRNLEILHITFVHSGVSSLKKVYKGFNSSEYEVLQPLIHVYQQL